MHTHAYIHTHTHLYIYTYLYIIYLYICDIHSLSMFIMVLWGCATCAALRSSLWPLWLVSEAVKQSSGLTLCIFHPFTSFHPYFIHISFIFDSRFIHIIHDALIITLHSAFTFSCCVCRKIVCIGPAEAAKQRLSPHKNSFKHLTTRPVKREDSFMILLG